MKHELTLEECIADLETLKQHFIETCGASPICLDCAIEELRKKCLQERKS